MEPPEPEADCLNLDAEVGHFDCQEDYQAALVALLHPSRRQDDQMEQQLTQLGWYQEELAKLHGEAGKKAALDQQATPKKDKAARAEAEADTDKKNQAKQAEKTRKGVES